MKIGKAKCLRTEIPHKFMTKAFTRGKKNKFSNTKKRPHFPQNVTVFFKVTLNARALPNTLPFLYNLA